MSTGVAFTVDDLAGLWEPLAQQPVALSPDGKLLAVALRREVDRPGSGAKAESSVPVSLEDKLGARLWLFDVASGQGRQLAEGADSWRPSWSPDGRRLAFYVFDGRSTAVWCWSAATNAVERVSDRPVATAIFATDAPRWSRDGLRVLVPVHPLIQPRVAPDVSAASVRVVRTAPGEAPAAQLLPSDVTAPRVIAAIDVGDGRLVEVSGGLPADAVYPSADGHWLAVTSVPRQPDPTAGTLHEDLWIIPSSGGAPAVTVSGLTGDVNASRHEPAWHPHRPTLAVVASGGVKLCSVDGVTVDIPAPEGLSSGLLVWHPDGRHVLGLTRGGVVAIDTATGESCLLAGPDGRTPLVPLHRAASPELCGVDASGSVLAGCTNRETHRGEVWRLPLDGSNGQLIWTHDAGCNFGSNSIMGTTQADASADGHNIVFGVQGADRPLEFWVSDSTFTNPKAAIVPNPQAAVPPLGTTSVVSWSAPDGQVRSATVLIPPRGTGPWPTVVMVYPGAAPTSIHQWGHGDIVSSQILAAEGFAVAMIDLPSAAGPMPNLPERGLVAEVDDAVDHLVAAGLVDPDRLAVAGHSAGAWVVNLLITETQRFAAAISCSGVADLAGLHNHISFRQDGTWLAYGQFIAEWLGGGAPWSAADTYVRRSPIYHLGNVTTPLLLLHGSADPAIPWTNPGAMFAGIAQLNGTAELAIYEDEGHGPRGWTITNQRDLAERILQFLRTHLTPPPPASNPPPPT